MNQPLPWKVHLPILFSDDMQPLAAVVSHKSAVYFTILKEFYDLDNWP